MSYISIQKNEMAIDYINSAISECETAKKNISSSNENDKIKEIVSLINTNISSLRNAIFVINGINDSISSALSEKDSEVEETEEVKNEEVVKTENEVKKAESIETATPSVTQKELTISKRDIHSVIE